MTQISGDSDLFPQPDFRSAGHYLLRRKTKKNAFDEKCLHFDCLREIVCGGLDPTSLHRLLVGVSYAVYPYGSTTPSTAPARKRFRAPVRFCQNSLISIES